MSLIVLDPGLHSLLVDLGRPRSRALGVPLGGAADRAALALGNALVGNAPDALALECTLAGPTLEAKERTACAVFGAAFPISVNERSIAAATTFTMEPGDVLRIGGTRSGVRGYLCVAGGFEAPAILDSHSALEPVKRGDVLMCPASWCEARGLPPEAHTSLALPSEDSGSRLIGVVRVMGGPQREWFLDDRFFTQDYEVTAASNRMGLRLKGEPLTRKPGEHVSEAVAPGAVQVTNDGLPIVLGADGQTIGGYPKIAHVIRADLDLLAQLRPGEQVRFMLVSQAEAELAAKYRANELQTWLTRLRIAERSPVLI